MIGYAARRLAFALALVFLSSSSALILTRLAPGDVTGEMQLEGVSATTLQREREQLRLDRSVMGQYAIWLRDAVRLDFGTSFRYDRPVGPLVVERAANTAVLALAALLLATLVGLPLGVLTATRPGTFVARLVRAGSVVALSLPPMLLSLLLAVFAARTGWLPIGGMRGALATPGFLPTVIDVGRHLVLPALALAIPVGALFERLQSRALAATLREPCLVAAAARGVPERRRHFLHGLRLALTPVASLYGVVAGSLLGGSFAVEIITAWPGLGRLMYEALISRDLYLVAGCAAIGACFVAAGTLVSDLVAAWNDPRLREGLSS